MRKLLFPVAFLAFGLLLFPGCLRLFPNSAASQQDGTARYEAPARERAKGIAEKQWVVTENNPMGGVMKRLHFAVRDRDGHEELLVIFSSHLDYRTFEIIGVGAAVEFVYGECRDPANKGIAVSYLMPRSR